MSEVKRFDFDIDEACANIRLVELADGGYTLFTDFDAQRLRADTAEAELENEKARIPQYIADRASAEQKLAAAEQRIADQHALLLKCKEVFDNCSGMSDQKTRVDWYANYLVPTKVDLNAALNPNPEAESHDRIPD